MKAILFDMDGTLLPMSQEDFSRAYFGGLTRFAAPLGFDKDAMVAMLWDGMKAMVKNDGSSTNAVRFWEVFERHFPNWNGDRSIFDRFYETDFKLTSQQVTPNAYAAKCVALLKEKGYRLIVATNPLFPESAQVERLRWAGLDPADFEYVTHFENSHFCKPNPAYYDEILQVLSLSPADCAMVGNDVEEDMQAGRAAGLSVWLLTDHLINRKERDINAYQHGDFAALYAWVQALPNA